MPYRKLTPAEQFFYDHAGYSYDPKRETARTGRRRCAIQAAQTEREARALGLTHTLEPDECFDWRDTPDGADDGCCPWCNEPLTERGECRREHYAYGMVLRDADGNDLGQSLWGIVDPDSAYERCTFVDLAGEYLHERSRLEALQPFAVSG